MLRYDEDYLFLKTDSTRNWYEKIKYSPLSINGNAFISYGGDVRFQYLYFKNENWGDVPQDKDGYMLTRWLAHADLHAGNHFRTFVQLQSSLSVSRNNPSPLDKNLLEAHQFFADAIVNTRSASNLTFRFGRQELLFGSQRLVSLDDGPNHRRSFDALAAMFSTLHYNIHVFFSHPVEPRPGIFDDGFNRKASLWGAYLGRNQFPGLKNLDLYYFGLWKRGAVFDDGEGEELRHSIGTRIWSTKGNWHYDFEGVYQFGKFCGKKISAWTASVKSSYQLTQMPMSPQLGLKTEVISGDKNYGDSKLQTFNPLFPRGLYFGLIEQIGPVNLIDVHPYVSSNLSKKLNLEFDYDEFWRCSGNDGLYAMDGKIYYSGKTSNERHIGGQFASELSYEPVQFLNFSWDLAWFKAGPFLKMAGSGKDIFYTCVTAQLTF